MSNNLSPRLSYKLKDLIKAGDLASIKLIQGLELLITKPYPDTNISPIQYSVLYGQLDILKYFESINKYSLYQVDDEGNSLLHLCFLNTFCDCMPILDYFFDQEFDLNCTNVHGQNIVHFCLLHRNFHALDHLLNYYDLTELLNSQDNNNLSPVDYLLDHSFRYLSKFMNNNATLSEIKIDIPENVVGFVLDQYGKTQAQEECIERYKNELKNPEWRSEVHQKLREMLNAEPEPINNSEYIPQDIAKLKDIIQFQNAVIASFCNSENDQTEIKYDDIENYYPEIYRHIGEIVKLIFNFNDKILGVPATQKLLNSCKNNIRPILYLGSNINKELFQISRIQSQMR